MTRRKVHTKICGLRTREAVNVCVDGGAAFIGFVFFEKSSRNISPEEVAEILYGISLGDVKTVAVMVNPSDENIEAMLRYFKPDYIQLHGDESPSRVREVRKYAKVIKAVPVANKEDISRATAYEGVADMLLFDTKDTKDTDEYGGTGRAFDWELLKGFSSSPPTPALPSELVPLKGGGSHSGVNTPWFLSGGLNIDNIDEAIRTTNAVYIDISSGVEQSKGVKDATLITRFLQHIKP